MTEAASADWRNYKSPAAKQAKPGEDLKNPGKAPLNAVDEYVFILDKVTLKQHVEGFKKGEQVDKFYTLWKEEKTGNAVMVGFRVDKLVYNYKSPRFQSPVLTFFEKIGIPIKEGVEPNWGNLFIEGMRIRGRVVCVKDDNGSPTGQYNLDLATCRRFMQ